MGLAESVHEVAPAIGVDDSGRTRELAEDEMANARCPNKRAQLRESVRCAKASGFQRICIRFRNSSPDARLVAVPEQLDKVEILENHKVIVEILLAVAGLKRVDWFFGRSGMKTDEIVSDVGVNDAIGAEQNGLNGALVDMDTHNGTQILYEGFERGRTRSFLGRKPGELPPPSLAVPVAEARE